MTDKLKNQREEFRKVSCPESLPGHDDGIERHVPIAFSDLIRVVSSHTNTIILGDTDHRQALFFDRLMRDSLPVLAEEGVKNLFIEFDTLLQPHIDDLAAGKVTPEQFADSVSNKFRLAHIADTRSHLLHSTAPLIREAADLGIKVHAADPMNGHDSGPSLRYGPNGEYRVRQENSQPIDLDYTFDDVEDRNIERFSDHELAAFINERARGEKSIVFYGAMHGSRYNDFEEHLESSSLRISLYADRKSYNDTDRERDYRRHPLSARTDYNPGEDKPDFVYFSAEHEAGITCNTPENLRLEIDRLAAAAPSEQEVPASAPSRGMYPR